MNKEPWQDCLEENGFDPSCYVKIKEEGIVGRITKSLIRQHEDELKSLLETIPYDYIYIVRMINRNEFSFMLYEHVGFLKLSKRVIGQGFAFFPAGGGPIHRVETSSKELAEIVARYFGCDVVLI